MEVNHEGGKATGQEAVTELGRIMSERERYKRLLLFAFVLLWVIAVLIPVFAPKDRMTVGLFASGSLVILSFGLIGARNFIFKALGVSIQASEGQAEKKETNRTKGTAH